MSFVYDANGNTTSKTDANGTTYYNYSINNRLLTVTTPTISASYQYDPIGRRIKKTVNGTTINYLWDENVMIAELDASNNITKLYTYNPKNNEPVSMTEGTDTYWYMNDHLMTPQKMVDSSEAIVWSAKYKVFGKVTIDTSSTITNNLRFPGQFYDSETGLHYNYHRYYNHSIGRYITADPILSLTLFVENIMRIKGENRNNYFLPPIFVSNPQIFNLYLYARNNPISILDFNGLICVDGGEMIKCFSENGIKLSWLAVGCVLAATLSAPTIVAAIAMVATCGQGLYIAGYCIGRGICDPDPSCN